MSILAWQILAVLVEHARSRNWDGAYLAGWTLRERLGLDVATIQGAHVRHGIGNEHEKALHELVTLGLVQEVPDLGERWQLIVK